MHIFKIVSQKFWAVKFSPAPHCLWGREKAVVFFLAFVFQKLLHLNHFILLLRRIGRKKAFNFFLPFALLTFFSGERRYASPGEHSGRTFHTCWNMFSGLHHTNQNGTSENFTAEKRRELHAIAFSREMLFYCETFSQNVLLEK